MKEEERCRESGGLWAKDRAAEGKLACLKEYSYVAEILVKGSISAYGGAKEEDYENNLSEARSEAADELYDADLNQNFTIKDVIIHEIDELH
jgi:hypothetical protein